MNEITKTLIKEINKLGINNVEVTKCGALDYDDERIIASDGDVNYDTWHDETLKHSYFKFDGCEHIYIHTIEQAKEFFLILKNFFIEKGELYNDTDNIHQQQNMVGLQIQKPAENKGLTLALASIVEEKEEFLKCQLAINDFNEEELEKINIGDTPSGKLYIMNDILNKRMVKEIEEKNRIDEEEKIKKEKEENIKKEKRKIENEKKQKKYNKKLNIYFGIFMLYIFLIMPFSNLILSIYNFKVSTMFTSVLITLFVGIVLFVRMMIGYGLGAKNEFLDKMDIILFTTKNGEKVTLFKLLTIIVVTCGAIKSLTF